MVLCAHACSIVSDSLKPHWLKPARLLCPWDFPGKNTGVGCHFLLQRIFLTQKLNLQLLHFLHWQADSLPPHQLGISTLLNLVQQDLSRAMETVPPWHSREGQAILWKMLGSPEMCQQWASPDKLIIFQYTIIYGNNICVPSEQYQQFLVYYLVISTIMTLLPSLFGLAAQTLSIMSPCLLSIYCPWRIVLTLFSFFKNQCLTFMLVNVQILVGPKFPGKFWHLPRGEAVWNDPLRNS